MQEARPAEKITRFLLYTLAIFLVLSLLYLPFSLLLQKNEDELARSEMVSAEEKLVDVEKTVISSKIDRLISDVMFAADSVALCSDDGDGYAGLKEQWIAFSNRKRIYDQICFLDRNGSEVVRVNYAPDGAYAVEDSKLQNKKDRYYFTDSIVLKKNQIYISKLDLNVENNAVEVPIKPMIRLATPYFDSGGVLQGVVILNYSASDVLNQVKKVASAGQNQLFLLNADGYWLYNSGDSAREWALMSPDRMGLSFRKEFPAEWEIISTQNSGSFSTRSGFFYHTSVFADNDIFAQNTAYSIVLGGGEEFLVSYTPADSAAGALFARTPGQTALHTLRRNAFVYLLLFSLAAVSGVFIVIKRYEKEKIRFFSQYDTMTGIYNRRMGLEKLGVMFASQKKSGLAMSICFIDINGLKEVNDTLGHVAGDELILSVAAGIRANIRPGDVAARLGGDEFLIAFAGITDTQAETVWQRISDYYRRINETENRRYLISVSHGIEMAGSATRDIIDVVVNRADEKMYAEKRIVKKDLQVIRH